MDGELRVVCPELMMRCRIVPTCSYVPSAGVLTPSSWFDGLLKCEDNLFTNEAVSAELRIMPNQHFSRLNIISKRLNSLHCCTVCSADTALRQPETFPVLVSALLTSRFRLSACSLRTGSTPVYRLFRCSFKARAQMSRQRS